MNTEYLSFCPRLKEMVESGKSTDLDGQPIDIGGVSTLGNLRAIRELILRNKYTKTLEVGLAYGGSALTFLTTMKEVSGDNFHHSAIDPFQRTDMGGASLRSISEEGFSDHFTFHEDYSCFVLADLARKEDRYDLIYVDGAHIFEDVFLDFYYCAKILKPGGIVLFDDCRDKHIIKVIKFIRNNYSDHLKEIDYKAIDDPEKPMVKKIGNALGVRQFCAFELVKDPPRPWNAPFTNF